MTTDPTLLLAVALAIYLACGLFAGLVSGLFGIGGGLVIVPSLVVALPLVKAGGPHLMHIAVGSSAAIVFATSLYTTILRHRRGDILWPLTLRCGIWLVVGAVIGALIGNSLSKDILKWVFVSFAVFSFARIILKQLGIGAKAADDGIVAPTTASIAGHGIFAGIIGALLGIGAALVMVPFLKQAGYAMGQAAAAAAALSAMVGAGSAVSYMAIGLRAADLPSLAFGYVYLPAFIGMAAGSLAGAPLGIRMSHRLSERAQFLLLCSLFPIILGVMLSR